MNKKIWIGLILFSIITIASVSWAVVFFSSKSHTLAPEPSSPPVHLEQAGTVSDWSFYQNPSAKVFFYIPKEWTIDEARDANNTSTGLITFLPTENAQPTAVTLIRVLFNSSQEELNLENSKVFTEIAKLPTKTTEAVVYQVQQEGKDVYLLSWFTLDGRDVFVEVHGDIAEEGLTYQAKLLKEFDSVNE